MAKTKANALPEMNVLEDCDKKYSYVLVQKNDERGMIYDGKTNKEIKGPDYKTRLNLLLRSSIVWDGSDMEFEKKNEDGSFDTNSKLIAGHRPGLYPIRYYDGCTSLSEDEQPKDRETIDRFVAGTREIFFLEGYLHIDGQDVMLRKYLDICSWNADSPYRSKRVQPIFMLANPENVAQAIDESIDLLEEALTLARKATDAKMKIHAIYLGVEMVDPKTSIEHSMKVVRAKYREMAKAHPKEFVESFNDDGILLSGWINRGMVQGDISTTLIPNKAVWKKGGSIICDITGLKADENILNRLVEYAKSDEGEGFKDMLEALYNK